jgi:hypothetical protein
MAIQQSEHRIDPERVVGDVPVWPATSALRDAACLKAIYHLQEQQRVVSITALSLRLGLCTSVVSTSIKRLSTHGFVEHEPYQSVGLTRLGVQTALAYIRTHRLLETLLVETFGYLTELGLTRGATLQVTGRAPFDGPLNLSVNSHLCVLDYFLAQHIRVSLV